MKITGTAESMKEDILTLKNGISELPDEQQALINGYYAEFKAILNQPNTANKELAEAALAIITGELAEELNHS